MLFINSQTELNNTCEILLGQKLIAIDTEFERRSTYFAKLALIQIATKQEVYIIDTLAGLDLEPLNHVLLSSEIIKIFHAPKQDLEIFWHRFGALPQNIFDTQLAAQFLGFGISISYDELCQSVCGIKLDKTHQKSDWRVRPIPQSQLIYAASDVIYLFKIYDVLNHKLMEDGKAAEYKAALLDLTSENNYKINYANAWKRVKCQDKSPEFLRNMEHLAAFREECAVALNVPRKYIVTNQELIALCKTLPSTNNDLDRFSLISNYLKQSKYRKKLLELCNNLKELNIDNLI